MSWIYFSYDRDIKLACPCCGTQGMTNEFMHFVDIIRDNVGLPFTVTSGYRCPDYNATMSRSICHTTGKAIDIHTPSSQHRYLILRELMNQGVKRIGIGKDFIHFDECSKRYEGLTEEVIWTYYRGQ